MWWSVSESGLLCFSIISSTADVIRVFKSEGDIPRTKDGSKVCSVCAKMSCEVPSAEFNGIIVGDSVSGELERKLRHLKKNGSYPLLVNKLMWKKSLFSQSWSTGPNVSIVEETPIYKWICPRICPPTSYFHFFPMIRSQVWCMCWVCVCVCLCVVFLPLSVGVCQAAVTELRGK